MRPIDTRIFVVKVDLTRPLEGEYVTNTPVGRTHPRSLLFQALKSDTVVAPCQTTPLFIGVIKRSASIVERKPTVIPRDDRVDPGASSMPGIGTRRFEHPL